VKLHSVRTRKSADHLPRTEQLAWKIAEVAADPVAVEPEVVEMIGNRIIDNAASPLAFASALWSSAAASPRSRALTTAWRRCRRGPQAVRRCICPAQP